MRICRVCGDFKSDNYKECCGVETDDFPEYEEHPDETESRDLMRELGIIEDFETYEEMVESEFPNYAS